MNELILFPDAIMVLPSGVCTGVPSGVPSGVCTKCRNYQTPDKKLFTNTVSRI